MEQKIQSLKSASKVIAMITKIGYTVMSVMMGICAAMLIFLAVTGGKTAMFALGGTDIIVFDQLASTPAELAALCAVLIAVGGMFFAIFLLANRMFRKISLTGKPFEEKHVKTVRVIGILTAAAPIFVGFVGGIATAFGSASDIPEISSGLPGIVVGAIIFCLSYILDYGCALEEKETV